MNDSVEFDPSGPLSRGIDLLEASAGTGKTYSLTNLVLRLVAEEDVRIDRILVVTFTRAATAELRERIRQRLAAGIEGLERAIDAPDWEPEAESDPVLHALITRGRGSESCAEMRRRLLLAHESFDEASISTIHGFCQQALQESALESDLEFDADLLEDLRPLLEEVVDDFIALEIGPRSAAWYRYLRDVARVDRNDLLSLAYTIERNPGIELLEHAGSGDDPEQTWARCLAAFRDAWAKGGAEATKVILEGHKAKIFRQKRGYNSSRPKTNRAALNGRLDTLERDFAELKEEIRYFGLSQILAALSPGQEIEHHEVFITAQRLVDESADHLKHRFVEFLREQLPQRKAARNVLSFDDLLRRLRASLSPNAGPSDVEAAQRIRRRLRERFEAALIDEFQDTDSVQWEIFRTVFGEDAWLYLIGDPKQAIYGFRGADVYTYLRARRSAGARRHTLMVNWRSDQRYVSALNALFEADGVFGEEGIEYVDVRAAPPNATDRLRIGGEPRPPLQLRFFPRELDGWGSISRMWPELPRYVAADVAALLGRSPEIHDPKTDLWRPVEPRDIAVLVRYNREARDIQTAMQEANVPAVITGAGSVFASREALALQRLLDALIQPASEGRAKAAWTSVLFGVEAAQLVAMDDVEWDDKLERLHDWSALWREQGFMRTLRQIFSDAQVPDRLLRHSDGERTMTNLLHVAELVHVAETKQRLGPSALAAWLRQRRQDRDGWEDEEELRLESDADAVTIVTVHRSKGLEYPIVFCPSLWDGQLLKTGLGEERNLRFHADDAERTLCLDLRSGTRFGPKLENVARARQEKQAEQMRLLYVALTRAKHRCVAYWGAFREFETSALARLLHPNRGGEDEQRLWRMGTIDDDDIHDDLNALAHAHPGEIEVVRVEPRVPVRWTNRVEDAEELEARCFERAGLDRWWRRSSYSSLTREAGEPLAPQGSPAAEGVDLDVDVDVEGPILSAVSAQDGAQSTKQTADLAPPLAEFPRGADPGTFLHRCLELFDFKQVDHPDELSTLLQAQLALHGIDDRWRPDLEVGLRAALRTPLGAAAGSLRLCDIDCADRLDELDFEFPVAGGYTTVEGRDHVRSRALAQAFRRHRAPSENMSADYLARLDALGFGPPVRGFLTGSIDLVFRQEVDGQAKWFIADYKSNWLGEADRKTTAAGHYGPSHLAEAMGHRHYYLQYHLYTLALHRYLRWRIPNYDYDRDFGGAYYLFLRGMVGDSGTGIFFDRPPRALIEALDDLFSVPERLDPLSREGARPGGK